MKTPTTVLELEVLRHDGGDEQSDDGKLKHCQLGSVLLVCVRIK